MVGKAHHCCASNYFCSSCATALVNPCRHQLQRKLTWSLSENYIQHLTHNSSSNFLSVDMEIVYSFSGCDFQLDLMNGPNLTSSS